MPQKIVLENFDSVFNHCLDILCLMDNTGTILQANPVFKQALGKSTDDLHNKSIFDFMLESDRGNAAHSFNQYINSDQNASSLQARFVNSQNEIIWLYWNFTRISEDSIIYAVGRNCTEPKNIEKSLSEQKQLYEQATSAGRVGIWNWDLTTDQIYVDPQIKSFIGFGDSEIDSNRLSWASHIHPDDLPYVETTLEKFINNNQPHFELVNRMIHKDGSILWIESRGSAIRDENGKPYRLVGTYTDITERKLIELKLQSRERILHAVSKSAELLMHAKTLDERMGEVLELLGNGISVNRVYIFENVKINNGKRAVRQRYEWTDETVSPQSENADSTNTTYRDRGISSWFEYICNGKEFFGNLEDFPEPERALLKSQHIKSLCVIPLYVQNKWWGCISFDDCTHHRTWDTIDQEGLISAASIIGSAIQRFSMEDDLQKSREQFKSIYDNTTIGLYQTTLEGDLLMVNPAIAHLLGFESPEEMLNSNKKIPELLPMYDRHPFLDKILKEEAIRNYESLWYTKDGKPVYINENASLVRDESGKILYIEGTIEDINDRKLAEEALKESETRLADAQRIGRLGNWQHDLLRQEMYWSNQMYRLFERDRKQGVPSLDEALLTYFYPEDIKIYKRKLDEVKLKQTDVEFDLRMKLPSGRSPYFHHILSSISDASGKVVKLVGTIQDITERKINEEQILKSQKLESVGMLAGGIAHDFNNLLTGILGNVALVKSELEADDELFYYLDEAEQATIHAKDLTTQLLTFSSGGKPIRVPTDLTGLIRNATNLVLKGHNVTVDYTFDTDLLPAVIDTGQIRQVIYNIIMNAQQAMPKGGRISVVAKNYTKTESDNLPLEEEPYVKISFTDEGIGIRKDELSRIFDPYYTTKRSGTGLGLATTYSIIQKHAGHIEVDSEIGVGSTFTLYLPAHDGDISRPELQPKRTRSQQELTGRVLIMDDEDFIRTLAERSLKKVGLTTVAVSNGEKAIREFTDHIQNNTPFDLVILDLTVTEGMGGKETIVKLREIDKEIKAIVCSGYSTDPVMSFYEQYGFNAVVSKPYKPTDLLETVSKLLRKLR